MEELGLDPADLGHMDTLRPKLKEMLQKHMSQVELLNDK